MTVQDLIAELGKHHPSDIVLVGSKTHRFNNDYFTDIAFTKGIQVFTDGSFYKDASNALNDAEATKNARFITTTKLPETLKAVVLVESRG